MIASPRSRSVRGQPHVGYYALQGGEDLISAAFKASPGSLTYSRNYECNQDGRPRRIDGYEVFDGQNKPSEASYWILGFTDGNAALAEGTLVSGAVGSGTVLTQVLESGTYAGGTAVGYLVLTDVTAGFVDDENLTVGAVLKAVADGVETEKSQEDDTLHLTYLHAAIEYARDQIAAIPGSGDPLGVWQYKGVKYGIRNNVGGTAAVMHKSSTAGWVACDLGRSVAFTSGGTTEIIENMILVGATSAAFATVKKVFLTSGTWAGGDAAGTFILYSQTGTFQAENLNISGGAANQATIGANSTANTLTKDGDYRFVNHNFKGHSDYFRMYGVDGVNKGFEWDGSTYAPITTGMTVDKPTHVFVYQNHLFYVFPGGSLQNSSIGDPYEWSPITDANEIGIGMDIVAALEMPGPSFVIFGRNTTWVLTGSTTSDFRLDHYSLTTGAIENTVTRLGNGMFIDDRGLTTLSAVQAYGNFKDNIISDLVQPIFIEKLSTIQCAVAIKSKSQYRLYYDDKTAYTLTVNRGKLMGFTRQEYDVQFLKVVSTEDANGFEEIFGIADDGFMYQIDKGTSFNGNAVSALIRTHFNNLGTPSNRKRIRKLELELEAPINTELNVGVEFDYSLTDSGGSQAFEIPAAGGFWDSVTWGDFYWGGQTVGSAEAKITGSGKNFCLVITSELTYEAPHTLQGYVVHYDVRGLKR